MAIILWSLTAPEFFTSTTLGESSGYKLLWWMQFYFSPSLSWSLTRHALHSTPVVSSQPAVCSSSSSSSNLPSSATSQHEATPLMIPWTPNYTCCSSSCNLQIPSSATSQLEATQPMILWTPHWKMESRGCWLHYEIPQCEVLSLPSLTHCGLATS